MARSAGPRPRAPRAPRAPRTIRPPRPRRTRHGGRLIERLCALGATLTLGLLALWIGSPQASLSAQAAPLSTATSPQRKPARPLARPATVPASHTIAMAVVGVRAVPTQNSIQPCAITPTHLPPAGPHGDRCRVAYQGNANGALWAPPSLSVAQLWRLAWSHGSPLADNRLRYCDGRGCLTETEYLWDSCFVAGCDPDWILAQTGIESSWGHAGAALYTGSIGNQRCESAALQRLYGVCTADDFQAYKSPFLAIDDEIRLLTYDRDVRHLADPASLGGSWAPPSDHNSPTYGQEIATAAAASQ